MWSAILLKLAPYALLLKIGAVIAMVGGLAYGVHTYNESLRESGRQEMRLEYQKKLLQAYKDKVKQESIWRKQQEDSNAQAAKRQTVLAANLATANLINSGLSSDLTSLRERLSDPAVGTDSNGAAAVKVVLGECTRELEGYAAKGVQLATSCDRHVNDLRRYAEQWPKVTTSP